MLSDDVDHRSCMPVGDLPDREVNIDSSQAELNLPLGDRVRNLSREIEQVEGDGQELVSPMFVGGQCEVAPVICDQVSIYHLVRFFSCGHATEKEALSVCWSVGQSVVIESKVEKRAF